MFDPREEDEISPEQVKTTLLFCKACRETFEANFENLIRHYKEICPEVGGIECNEKPYCHFIGTRREFKLHVETCEYQKFDCEKCQCSVIRKIKD